MATVTNHRVVAGGRVLVSAVAEPRDPWGTEICRLFATLRALGDGLRDAKATALFTGKPDDHTVARLRALDVEIREVRPVEPRCPHANKIRMLEQDDDVDWIVALDTDMLVTGDLSDYLDASAVRLRVVDVSSISRSQWRRVFRSFGVAPPRERLRTTSSGRLTRGYFNSGAVFVPRPYARPLAMTWNGFVPKVLDALPGLDLADHAFYTDQIALTLSLASSGVPIAPLPVEVNTPSHAPIHRRWRPDSIAPRLVHYHHNVDAEGQVRPSGYAGVDSRIQLANAAWEDVARKVSP